MAFQARNGDDKMGQDRNVSFYVIFNISHICAVIVRLNRTCNPTFVTYEATGRVIKLRYPSFRRTAICMFL